MNQSESDQFRQTQKNTLQNIHLGPGKNRITFAPVQIGTQIETQIIQISVEKVTQRQLIKASPYKGLKRFNFSDRENFFGRDALIKRLFVDVNKSSLSLVVGASGSGKSSVIRAGLIPELKKDLASTRLFDFIFTPNQNPFESFSSCLRSEEKDYKFKKSDAAIALEAKSDTMAKVIRQLKKKDERWLIFIDQFEELFTNCGDLELRQNFINSLVEVAEAKDNTVRIVMGMRADFFEQFSAYPALGPILNQNNIHLVTEMHPDELRQAIEQPAAKHGVVFEEGLVEQIIKDVQGQSGYLPLLQYTLNLFWETECRELGEDGRPNIERRTLNRSTYNALGGVRGALQKRVNLIYQNLNQDEQIATKQIFLKLVNIVETEGGSRAVSRRAYRSEFVGDLIKTTLQRFIDENLLVSGNEYASEEDLLIGGSSNRQQQSTVEIAHEILLSSWAELKRWLEEEKKAIILKNWLADETKRWQKIQASDESKAKDELLKGTRLEELVVRREGNAFKKLGGLSPDENEYIDLSVEWRDSLIKQEEERRKRETRQARRIAIGSTVAAIFMAGLAGLSGIQLRKAEIEQIRTSLSLSESHLLADQGLQARVESAKAGAIVENSLWQRFWPEQGLKEKILIQLQKTLFATTEINNLTGLQGSVNQVVFSPDGNYVAGSSENGAVQIWNRQGKLLAQLEGHQGMVLGMTFNPEGTQLATSGEDGTARIWNLDGKEVAQMKIEPTQEDEPNEGNFQSLDPSIGPDGWVWDIVFSPDGSTVATSDEGGTVQLWDLQGNQLAQLRGHEGAVWEVEFGPQGVLATRGEDGIARLWNERGRLLAELRGHRGPIWDMAFDPSQLQLVTSGEDGTVQIWDFQGNQLEQLTGHQGPVTRVIYGSNGLLATRSEDGTARIWDVENKLSTEIKGKTGPVWDISFNADGSHLALLEEDSKIRLWKITKVTLERYGYRTRTTSFEYRLNTTFLDEFKGHQGRVWKVSFDPNEPELLSAGENGMVRVWALKNNQTELIGKQSWRSQWSSPDGTKLVMKDDKGSISVWDINGNLLTQADVIKDPSSDVNWRFSPDSNYLIISAGSSYKNNLMTYLLNIQTEELIQLKGGLYENWNNLVENTGFSPDGTVFVTVTEDNVYLWDIEGNQLARLRNYGGDLAFAPDNNHLATTSKDNNIILWNLNGEQIAELKNNKTNSEHNISDVIFSPDSNYLAASDGDNWVQVWDIKGNLKTSFNTDHRQAGQGFELAFSPDSQQLITASFSSGAMGDRLAKLWDIEGKQLVQLIERNEEERGQVTQLEFSPDRKLLVASSDNGLVYLWDFQGNLLDKIPRPSVWGVGFKFSPDSQYLAIYGGGTFPKIWQLSDGQPAKLVVELKGYLGEVTNLQFNPSGNQIVTRGDDGTVQFWDFQGNLLLQLQGAIDDIRFSSDGNWFITKKDVNYGGKSQENHRRIDAWNIGEIDSLLSSVCSSINSYLINNETTTPEDKNLCQGFTQN